MKEIKIDIRSRIRKKYFYQILFCACVACLADALVLVGFSMFQRQNLSYTSAAFYANQAMNRLEMGNSYTGDMIIWLFLLLIIGIAVFSVSFMLIQEPGVRYMGDISEAMDQIIKGDLDAGLEIRGDDELALMATMLNDLGRKVQGLMDQEREAERMKNDLITSVAHDLRTPLTSVIGYLDILNRNRALPEEKKQEFIQITYQKAKRLEQLIEDLFGFTKLGKVALKVVRLDLVQLVQQMLDEFYPNFVSNDMHYEMRTNADTVMMEADGNLLARLFENLISNAIRYGKEGKLVQVEMILKEQTVTISVKNYGFVIPENKIQHIFDKFYRVEESRTSSVGGTGLGLAIAKSIVELHQGTIQVKSDLDGTVFTVMLPLSAQTDIME